MRALGAFQQANSTGNVEQAEAAALEAMQLAAEEAEKNPPPERALQEAVSQCEVQGDWAGAEAGYRQLLALQVAAGNCGLIFQAQHSLTRFYLLLGELDQAEACAPAATAAARQADLFPLLVIALESEASCALRRADLDQALAKAQEIVTIMEPGPANDFLRAGALVLRALCRTALGDATGAEQDLEASKPTLLHREISPLFAGQLSKVASWWEATAAACALRNDLAGAADALEKAVELRRHIATLPQVSGPYARAALARSLRRWGKALADAGRPEEGHAATAEAERLWSELGLPRPALLGP